MGIGRNRVFNISAIEELIRDTRHLMDAAEGVTGELYQEMCELADVLRSLPDDVRDEGLYADVLQMRQNLRTSEFRDYREEMTKNLRRLCSNIASGDRKCGKDFLNTAADFRSITEKIRSLTELIPEGADSGTYEDFKKKFDECTKSWDIVNNSLERMREILRNRLNGLHVSGVCQCGDPVTISTGNFVYEKEDLRIPGRPELRFIRTYNALSKEEGVLGTGFRHTYENNLSETEEEIVLYAGDGHEEHFAKQSDGRLKSESSRGILKEEADGYTYTTPEESITVFDKEGKQVSWQDAGRNRLTFRYEGKHLCEVIRESDKRKLCFAYDGEGRLIGAEDVSYTYDEDGRLIKVTGTDGGEISYTYDESGLLNGVTNPLGVTTIENEYDDEGRCIRQHFLDGGSMSYAYDDENSCVELTERNGSKTTYYHDERYHHTKTVYEDGEEKYAYNAKGQCVRHKDCNGNITRYSYDGKGNLAQVLYADGMKENATYDGKNHLIRLSVNGKEKLHNSYDSNGNLTESRDALGRVTTFLYEEQGAAATSHTPGRLTGICRPDGSTIHLTSDERGNITKITDPYGNESHYTYDSDNRIILVTDPRGGKTAYSYDKRGRVTGVTDALGNRTSYVYNAAGKRVKEIRADGSMIETEYNNLNRPSALIDAEGNRTEYTYDSMWNVASVKAPNGGVTRYEYDGRERLIRHTDALGYSTEYAYDAQGNPVLTRYPNGSEVHAAYDNRNRRTSVTDAEGHTTTYRYDEEGRIIEIENAAGGIYRCTYDEMGQKVSETDNTGAVVSYTYNMLGKKASITDALGNTTHYEYDYNGNLTKVTDAKGNETCCTYDSMGGLLGVTRYEGTADAKGKEETTRYRRDLLGRIISITDPSGREETYTYDELGRMTGKRDRNGAKTVYTYTLNGNRENIIYTDGRKETYRYDPMGTLREIEDMTGVTRLEHDALGRIQKVTNPYGKEISCEWGAMGERRKLIYPDGEEAVYNYNKSGQLTELITRENKITYTYDEAGRLMEKNFPNGTASHYAYGENGQLASLVHAMTRTEDAKETECILSKTEYRYDETGNNIGIRRERADMAEESGSYSYAYDSLNRLTEVRKDSTLLRSYRYDAFGNRTGKTEYQNDMRYETAYTYDETDRLIREIIDIPEAAESKEKIYTYDESGALLTVSENGQKVQGYTYDGAQRVIEAEVLKNGVWEKSVYSYNHKNQRTQEQIYQKSTEGNGENSYFPTQTFRYTVDITMPYHNLLMTETEDVSQGVMPRTKQTYIWDDGIAALMEGEKSRCSYYLRDELGSVESLYNEAGEIRGSYAYDEFGMPALRNREFRQNGAESFQPFGYTGYQKEESTGLYYAQARRYNAEAGRFISEDIIPGTAEEPHTLNHYIYCWNRPLDLVDRDGRTAERADSLNAGIFKAMDDIKSEMDSQTNTTETGCTLNEDVAEEESDVGVGKQVTSSLRALITSVGVLTNSVIGQLQKKNWADSIFGNIKEIVEEMIEEILEEKEKEKEPLYKDTKDLISKITEINHDFDTYVEDFQQTYKNYKDRYEELSKKVGIPAELIAIIHYRENTADYLGGTFDSYLHNGEQLGNVTEKYPKGKLFYTFEEAAIDAIQGKGETIEKYKLTSDSEDIISMLCFAEEYNGLGYYKNGHVSPYLYSGTNVYISGKYVEILDENGSYISKYEADLVDRQVGAYLLLNSILEE